MKFALYLGMCAAVLPVYGSREKLPVHDHSDNPTIYVYLSDSGPVRFSHVEEHAFTLIRPPEKAVELKRAPLGFQPGSFRSPKSSDTSQSGVSTEFECKYFSIQRIVAAGDDSTRIQTSGAPALLIAFTPASLESSSAGRGIKPGDVVWIDPDVMSTLRNTGTPNADLLQIKFA